MYLLVSKQPKQAIEGKFEPETFVVEEAELTHFLHEQSSPTHILVFTQLPDRNVYTTANTED